jgi:hypothetical protein
MCPDSQTFCSYPIAVSCPATPDSSALHLWIKESEKGKWCFSILFIYFFCGPGVWTQGLGLVRQVLYYLSHATSLYLSIFIKIVLAHESSKVCQGLPHFENCWSSSTWSVCLKISSAWMEMTVGIPTKMDPMRVQCGQRLGQHLREVSGHRAGRLV